MAMPGAIKPASGLFLRHAAAAEPFPLPLPTGLPTEPKPVVSNSVRGSMDN
ncbi:hypothetical protein SAMN05880590_102680 [Rhizobium sp. RU35A]|nr:hypothetical protein SAMN05880590_102680 [Rhizobium sp. RU35A]